MLRDHNRGFIAVAASAAIWGVYPFYYRALADVPALQVLAHRALWSFVFFGSWAVMSGRGRALLPAFRGRLGLTVLAASLVVSFNWLVYIIAIQTGHTLSASLGYYMLPLVSVILGIAMFGEWPRPGQWLAIGLAALAVTLLAIGLQATPWVSLILAVSFGLYGAIKKGVRLPPALSVTAEVAWLAPVALAYLLWPHAPVPGQPAHFGSSLTTALLLIATGPLTAAPLILFSYGSQRLPMAATGLVMYINPTLQLLVAVMIFGEVFTPWHALAFSLIWGALALYAWEGWRHGRLQAARLQEVPGQEGRVQEGRA